MVKHAPSMEKTLDSNTQGASLFLDPTGAQVGEYIQGEEGIVYGDLDLNECIEPKQFHDVVGYYQRYDVFDLKVNRTRQGAEMAFQPEVTVVEDDSIGAPAAARGQSNVETTSERRGHGGMRIL
jgi:aliphatic nitrilase